MCRQSGKLHAAAVEEGVTADKEDVRSLAPKAGESRIYFEAGTRVAEADGLMVMRFVTESRRPFRQFRNGSFRQDERLLGLRKLNAAELARSFNHGLLNRESFRRRAPDITM